MDCLKKCAIYMLIQMIIYAENIVSIIFDFQISKTNDLSEDADIWADSFFARKVTRYLCFTRKYPLDNVSQFRDNLCIVIHLCKSLDIHGSEQHVQFIILLFQPVKY